MFENTASSSPIALEAFPQPILHIDCDAFFTSVEQALNPQLKGRPVVTGKERGIVACASYEAKALGVRRPVALWEARKICPDLVCLPSDYETYSLYSRRMFSIIRRFTPEVEEYSIDEAFAEISGLRRIHRMGYSQIAMQIKQTIQKELGITVSVGFSSSKTLAKIASKQNKPDGFTVFRANELHRILPSISLDRVCGFGPNTVALLHKRGIRSVWDYVQQSEGWAQRLLGKIGLELWHELRGKAMYAIQTEEKHDYASISKTKTFTPPSSDKEFVQAQLLRNLESAFIKLRRHKLRAKAMTVFLRDQEFGSEGCAGALDRSTSSTMEAAALAIELLEKLFRPGKLYRLTGVVLSKLDADDAIQYSLFDDIPKIESFRAVDAVIDGVNELYGKHALHLGTGLWLGKHRQHLASRGDLPQRKTRLLRGETYRQRIHIPMWQVTV